MPIYVHRNNQQLGPYSAAEVRTQLANGALSVHDHVWWHGRSDWIPLGESEVMSKNFKEPPGPSRARYQKDPRLSVLAVCSLIANAGCAVGSLASIIMGHMALSAMKEEPTLKGRNLAIYGLIIGYLLTLIYAAIIVTYILLMPEFAKQAEEAQLRQQVSTPSLPTNSAPQPPPPAPAPSVPTTNPAPAAPVPPVTAPATTNSPMPSTNAPDSTTNAAPINP